MRFDEFIARDGVAVSPVDQFDGLAVDVGVPADWDPLIPPQASAYGCVATTRASTSSAPTPY